MADTIDVGLTLQDAAGMAFDAELPTGHHVLLDAGEDHGGQDLGPRPMHMMLVSLAGCTAMDVISFLRKMRQPVEGYRVEVSGVRAEEDPKVYTHITIKHIAIGDVEEGRLARAVELSATKYCSAQAMLRQAAEIEVSFEVRAAGE
jgi:putative redox protein